MKRVYPEEHWPDSWKSSFNYDLQEIYGEHINLGYSYTYTNRRKYTFDLIREVLVPGSTVLDIAAAQGNFSLALAELGYQVTWNDIRAELIDYVRSKYETGTLTFVPGNAFELEFPDLFDAVLITEVIEHVAHPDKFLRNTARLVKPGGYIIMTTPNGKYFRNDLPKFSDCRDPSIFEAVQFGPNSDSHIFLLHEEEIRSFAKSAGLQMEKFMLFNNPLTSGHVKLARLLKILSKDLVFTIEFASSHLPQPIANKLLAQMAVRFRVP